MKQNKKHIKNAQDFGRQDLLSILRRKCFENQFKYVLKLQIKKCDIALKSMLTLLSFQPVLVLTTISPCFSCHVERFSCYDQTVYV